MSLTLTHYWDCNGFGCDSTTLQPWNESAYFASAAYAPLTQPSTAGRRRTASRSALRRGVGRPRRPRRRRPVLRHRQRQPRLRALRAADGADGGVAGDEGDRDEEEPLPAVERRLRGGLAAPRPRRPRLRPRRVLHRQRLRHGVARRRRRRLGIPAGAPRRVARVVFARRLVRAPRRHGGGERRVRRAAAAVCPRLRALCGVGLDGGQPDGELLADRRLPVRVGRARGRRLRRQRADAAGAEAAAPPPTPAAASAAGVSTSVAVGIGVAVFAGLPASSPPRCSASTAAAAPPPRRRAAGGAGGRRVI